MNSREELLAELMNFLGQEFRSQLVLKGGMLLRLYNSSRATKDIDYLWVSKESGKILKDQLIKAFHTWGKVKIGEIRLNSRGVFIDIMDLENKQKVLLEISVVPKTYQPPIPLSTAPLSQKYQLAAQVVSTMAISEAYSHKIAATLERNAPRDLYDLSQFEGMGAFDKETLTARLSKLTIDPAKPQSLNFLEAAALLRKKIDNLKQENIEAELYPLLPEEYHAGLMGLLRASVGRLIQRLEVTT